MTCSVLKVHNLNYKRSLSSATLLPLPDEKSKPKVVRLKRNLRTLGKVKHIALSRVHFLARLVRDVEAAVDNDLHLVVRVLVDKRSACREQEVWSVLVIRPCSGK